MTKEKKDKKVKTLAETSVGATDGHVQAQTIPTGPPGDGQGKPAADEAISKKQLKK
jgi:hypothetical protein